MNTHFLEALQIFCMHLRQWTSCSLYVGNFKLVVFVLASPNRFDHSFKFVSQYTLTVFWTRVGTCWYRNDFKSMGMIKKSTLLKPTKFESWDGFISQAGFPIWCEIYMSRVRACNWAWNGLTPNAWVLATLPKLQHNVNVDLHLVSKYDFYVMLCIPTALPSTGCRMSSSKLHFGESNSKVV